MGEFPRATLAENLRFAWTYLIPTALQGPFLRRRRMVGLVSALRRGRLAAGPGGELRRKYGGRGGVFVRFPVAPSLLLFDPAAIRTVLEDSPNRFADCESKRKGMKHFQPQAVTISRGEAFRERRAFNEEILCPGRLHPDAERILGVVREEAGAAFGSVNEIGWGTFAELFEAITLRVVFGRADARQRRVRAQLARLMGEANKRRPPAHGKLWESHCADLTEAIAEATPESLAGRARDQSPADDFPVADQITHWLFAMNDTLAENVVRAAALIESLPEVAERARQELAGTEIGTASAVAGLAYLNGCIQEAMRLWPTTPFLLREVVESTPLCGVPVPEGTQIVIANVIDHLALTGGVGAADPTAFDPDRWESLPEVFHHFGGGAQRCPGEDLALFLAAGALACLLAGGRYRVRRPRIDSADRLPASFNPFAIRLQRI